MARTTQRMPKWRRRRKASDGQVVFRLDVVQDDGKVIESHLTASPEGLAQLLLGVGREMVAFPPGKGRKDSKFMISTCRS